MTITVTNGGRRMPHPDLAVVTGAFSYTGRYVTRRLLDQGVRVRILTRSPDAEDPFGGRVEVICGSWRSLHRPGAISEGPARPIRSHLLRPHSGSSIRVRLASSGPDYATLWPLHAGRRPRVLRASHRRSLREDPLLASVRARATQIHRYLRVAWNTRRAFCLAGSAIRLSVLKYYII